MKNETKIYFLSKDKKKYEEWNLKISKLSNLKIYPIDKPEKIAKNKSNTILLWDYMTYPNFKSYLNFDSKLNIVLVNESTSIIPKDVFQFGIRYYWDHNTDHNIITRDLGSIISLIKSNLLKANYRRIIHTILNRIIIPQQNGFELISYMDVIRIEAARSYSIIYQIDQQSLVVSKSLSELESEIESDLFIRSHQSHLINILHLKGFSREDGGRLIMEDGTTVPLAIRRKDDILERINKLNSSIH